MYDLKVGDLICIEPKNKICIWEYQNFKNRITFYKGTEYYAIYLRYFSLDTILIFVNSQMFCMATYHRGLSIKKVDA